MSLPTLVTMVGVAALASAPLTPAQRHDIDEEIAEATRDVGVLVVASSRSYEVARRAAKTFSKASGIAYNSQGMIFDKKRGLIWPDDFGDQAFAGGYFPRRDDTCGDERCVTIERSDRYPGFKRGYYIVVAGILDPESLADRLDEARNITRGAYVRRTPVYYGCLH